MESAGGRRDGSSRSARRVRPVAPVGAGFLLGVLVVVLAGRDRAGPLRDDGFAVWAVLAVTLTTASGAVLELGLRRVREVDAVRAVPRRTVILEVAFVAVLVVLLVLTSLVLDPGASTARGVVLVLVTIAGSTPVAVALVGIGQVARAPGLRLGARVGDYLALRDLARGLLPPLGALVALATLALGAAGAMRPEAAATGPAVLVFGSVGTAVIALVYSRARGALRAEGYALVLLLTPFPDDDAEQVVATLDARTTVQDQLGLTTSLIAELSAGVLVLGPLLSGLIAVYVVG